MSYIELLAYISELKIQPSLNSILIPLHIRNSSQNNPHGSIGTNNPSSVVDASAGGMSHMAADSSNISNSVSLSASGSTVSASQLGASTSTATAWHSDCLRAGS